MERTVIIIDEAEPCFNENSRQIFIFSWERTCQ